MAGSASTSPDRPEPARDFSSGSCAAYAIALAELRRPVLLVNLPRLRGTDHVSFPYWARCDSQQIRAEMSDDRRPDRIRVLSQIALRKYQGQGRAPYLLLAAVALIVIDGVALIGTVHPERFTIDPTQA
ncbi:integral membrane plasmid transfer protein (plasmid) [Streptomyces sp. NBC_01340]|uniref:integral membrane plasmid transfer protein n=1 Tax=unclassified Streptomyces TaxID=2593676 RepID=UPI00224C992E|nr:MULTISPECIES: integral membrane plasmid transfer protein [unclassified Streptomyces]MCX4460290.1 integral membrane plasmid transfer protein [Streptomyces sp. NBC_01719]MCX4500379.1 integral membrane plasmid transfer protein [Streptomyces sp. NBC_01728]MCX4598086.1 integral membrane plasmid transfer protein [Streptomyces sp. NBC_01549]WSI45424.1 integral membrane plasmid transfer protein [Streptomyces sp. NBC_01340]